jgi:hypothetical protein
MKTTTYMAIKPSLDDILKNKSPKFEVGLTTFNETGREIKKHKKDSEQGGLGK